LGYEAQHTWGLEFGNRTPDDQVAQITDRDNAVIVTKDADFLNAHILIGSPKRLLLLSTGNIVPIRFAPGLVVALLLGTAFQNARPIARF
jgi:predicted nuclease of predicted toxin-antitoxin system